MNEWIEHDGKSIPADVCGLKVDVRTKNGTIFNAQSFNERFWLWDGSLLDIVSYRACSPSRSLFDAGVVDHF